jgi:hypothetical protein
MVSVSPVPLAVTRRLPFFIMISVDDPSIAARNSVPMEVMIADGVVIE